MPSKIKRARSSSARPERPRSAVVVAAPPQVERPPSSSPTAVPPNVARLSTPLFMPLFMQPAAETSGRPFQSCASEDSDNITPVRLRAPADPVATDAVGNEPKNTAPPLSPPQEIGRVRPHVHKAVPRSMAPVPFSPTMITEMKARLVGLRQMANTNMLSVSTAAQTTLSRCYFSEPPPPTPTTTTPLS